MMVSEMAPYDLIDLHAAYEYEDNKQRVQTLFNCLYRGGHSFASKEQAAGCFFVYLTRLYNREYCS